MKEFLFTSTCTQDLNIIRTPRTPDLLVQRDSGGNLLLK